MNRHRLCISTLGCDVKSIFTDRCIEVYCETETISLRPVWHHADFPNVPGDAYIVNLLPDEDEIVLKLKGVPIFEVPGLHDQHFTMANWTINLNGGFFDHLTDAMSVHYADFMRSISSRTPKYA